MRYESPLRYPGGKRRLAQYFKVLFRVNDLLDSEYVEPYAGGASVALALLFGQYASRIHINDLSLPVYAFWHAVLNDTERLCRRVNDARLTLAEYRRQKATIRAGDGDLSELGFAAFYVNRTSRSGIIDMRAGVIGGNAQDGAWRLDARYNRKALINRIERVARQAQRIRLYNLDAEVLLRTVTPKLSPRTFVYLDPPYYRKGQRLYTNFYEPDDHSVLAARVLRLRQPWVISYDDVPEVRLLYSGQDRQRFGVPYSAANRCVGAEVLFFSKGVVPPKVKDPARFTEEALRRWIRSCKGRTAVDRLAGDRDMLRGPVL